MSTKKPIARGSVKDKIVHPDLQAERDKACFDTEELKTFMMGGAECRKERDYLTELYNSDPLLKPDHHWFDLTREEQQERMYKRMGRLAEIDHGRFYANFEAKPYFSYMWLNQGQVSLIQ
jgi:hypothetical protein